MKIVHLTDTHLGYAQFDAEVNYNNLKRVLYPQIDSSVTAVAMTGDYLHALLHLENRATVVAYQVMEDLKELCRPHQIPIILLRGTAEHDRRQMDFFAEGYEHFYYFDTMSIVKIPNIGYVGAIPDDLPYPDAQRVFMKRVKDETPNGRVDLLLLHGYLKEEIPPNTPIEPYNVFDVRSLAKVAPLVLKGHIHTPRVYRRDDCVIVSGGSFELMRHGEEGRRGLHVITTEVGARTQVEFVENKGTYVYTTLDIADDVADVYQTFKGLVEDVLRRCNEHTPEPLNIRLRCSTDVRDQIPTDYLDTPKRIKYTFKSTNLAKVRVADTAIKRLDLPPITEESTPIALSAYLKGRLTPQRITEILKEVADA